MDEEVPYFAADESQLYQLLLFDSLGLIGRELLLIPLNQCNPSIIQEATETGEIL